MTRQLTPGRRVSPAVELTLQPADSRPAGLAPRVLVRLVRPGRNTWVNSGPSWTRLSFTGTPMENNLMEPWSLLSITAPGLFPEPRPGFRDYYARPIEKGSDTELLAQLRRRGEPYRDRRETTIAGKPTVTLWGSGFYVYLSPGGDLAERGNVHIGLTPMGGRGVATGRRKPR